MEARLLVKILVKLVITLCLSTLIIVSTSTTADAKTRQRISFYKINKDDITQALRFVRGKARKPGCHNFIRKARLHKVVQFSYQQCQVYSEKNCAADSIMQFYRDDEPEIIQSDLSEGFGWRPVGEHKRGEKAKSWNCDLAEE